MVPSQWFSSAERYLTNPKKAEESFKELLEKHPEPKSLLDYLNERRFILLLRLLDHSECMRKFLINHPTDFQNVIPGLWYVSKRKEDYLRELEELVSPHSEDKKFSEKLAYYRHRELMRLLSKEFLGTAKLEDILREYSELPDALLELAYRKSLSEAIDLYGEPLEEDQKPATACIVGLGKLGSYELNYYSDIDIMFIHSSDKGKAGKLTLNEFFSKVFQKVVSLMTSITPEGKPYEVDLDLRPFGKSGPISMSLRSVELYYESYGRMWERFALLRARYSAGDPELYRAFEKEVKEPFVFRKSIDYRVLEEIRLIKAQINAQAKKRLLNKINVKTGEGGIREVEFMVQAMVLLFGGKFPFLRESNTIRALWKLHQKGVFSMEEVEFLESAYVFLRKLEHRIQMKNCTQNHAFSPQEVPLLAKLMGMDVEEFQRRFQEYTKRISQMFYNMLPAHEEKELDPLMAYLLEGDQESGKELLASLGFKNPTRVFNILLNYVQGSFGISLSSEERKQFYELLPQMVKMMASTPDPDETLNNFDKFFSNPTGRRVILSNSREDFRKRLCKVFSLSSYLSTLISRNPDLVEDVLTLYQDYPDQNRLEEEFEKYKERLSLSPENLFRRFKTVWEVRNALVYLVKQEDRYTKLEKFFLSLSELADFLMKKLWQFSDGVCLYALGKYGSQELTIGSDLDLVFVAKSPSFEEIKLAQQMIKFITLHTSEGYLYKLDFRLRPMGSKGELLPSIDFYRDYFEKSARTWERIAWTRARFIVGDTALRDEFEEVIENFLFSKPITEREIREIRDMRFALESNAKKDKELIDIKFGKGGLIDGEFLIQLYILREKLREPSMIRAYRILAPKHSLLREAFEIYMFFRLVETRHRLSKEHGGSVLNKKDRERVASSLNMSFEDFEDKLRESLKRMREIFLEVFEV